MVRSQTDDDDFTELVTRLQKLRESIDVGYHFTTSGSPRRLNYDASILDDGIPAAASPPRHSSTRDAVTYTILVPSLVEHVKDRRDCCFKIPQSAVLVTCRDLIVEVLMRILELLVTALPPEVAQLLTKPDRFAMFVSAGESRGVVSPEQLLKKLDCTHPLVLFERRHVSL